jgi:fructan beta-fructosidase
MTQRPLFHFTAPQNWLNDPNGMVYFDGEWHLFYQYNPYGNEWGHMSWGHAVSRDMLRWEHLPLAMHEQPDYMIYSGSAAVDWPNTAGFGERALVATYTAHYKDVEAQHLAYSIDRGRTWQHYAGNPIIAGQPDFRDPKIFWHAPTQRWIMVTVLAMEHKARFFGSSNLREWTHLSDFGPAGAHAGAWECPDMFALRAPLPNPSPEGRGLEREKWILKIDDAHGIDGHSGGQYFIGTFDGTTFTCDDAPEMVRTIDYGMDFYAAQSWSDVPQADGRRVWLAWMSYWAYANKTPTSPWRSMMTLPREVALHEHEGGLYLAQQPVRELRTLRRRHWHIDNASVAEAAAWMQVQAIGGTALEIDVTMDAAEFGLDVRVGAAERTTIGYDGNNLFVDRSQSGQNHFSPHFADRNAVALNRANVQRLHVFVDACSVEVFADDGRVVMSELIFPAEDSHGLALRGVGRVASLDVWTLA